MPLSYVLYMARFNSFNLHRDAMRNQYCDVEICVDHYARRGE